MFKTPESEVAKFNYQQDKQIYLEIVMLDIGQQFFHMTERRELGRAVKRLHQKTTELINEVTALSLTFLNLFFLNTVKEYFSRRRTSLHLDS